MSAEPLVGDIMTPSPTTVDAQARLSEAWELMEGKQIQHIPVTHEGRLVGMLSERHLRDAMPSVLTLEDPEARKRALFLTRVEKVCVANPETVNPETSLLDAIGVMRRLKGGSLPVTDETGQLVGILTAGDLISYLEKLLRS